jgi:hypothetical protein
MTIPETQFLPCAKTQNTCVCSVMRKREKPGFTHIGYFGFLRGLRNPVSGFFVLIGHVSLGRNRVLHI